MTPEEIRDYHRQRYEEMLRTYQYGDHCPHRFIAYGNWQCWVGDEFVGPCWLGISELDPSPCPAEFGWHTAWRSVVAEIATILESDAYLDVCAVINRVATMTAHLPNGACLRMALDSLEYHRQSHYHNRGGDLLRAAGWARTTGSGSTSGSNYLCWGDQERRD